MIYYINKYILRWYLTQHWWDFLRPSVKELKTWKPVSEHAFLNHRLKPTCSKNITLLTTLSLPRWCCTRRLSATVWDQRWLASSVHSSSNSWWVSDSSATTLFTNPDSSFSNWVTSLSAPNPKSPASLEWNTLFAWFGERSLLPLHRRRRTPTSCSRASMTFPCFRFDL